MSRTGTRVHFPPGAVRAARGVRRSAVDACRAASPKTREPRVGAAADRYRMLHVAVADDMPSFVGPVRPVLPLPPSHGEQTCFSVCSLRRPRATRRHPEPWLFVARFGALPPGRERRTGTNRNKRFRPGRTGDVGCGMDVTSELVNPAFLSNGEVAWWQLLD